MAPIKWDAYRTLNITSRNSGGTTCVGKTQFGKRCRWDIPEREFYQICSILDKFETKAPAKAMSSLETLAQLSLCKQYHKHQVSEKVDEWEIAIHEASKFYKSGKCLEDKNRELEEMLKEEISEREELERKIEAEMSRRDQELESIGAMSMEVSSLRAKLEKSETEAKNSKAAAQKMSKSYDKYVAETEERILIHRAEWNDEHRKMKTTLQKEAQTINLISSKLQKSKANETTLVNQVFELTSHLETERHANNTLQSELTQSKSERDLALSQKNEFKSQLEISAKKIDQIGFSLQEAEAARDTLSEEKQRLHSRLSIEDQNLKAISNAKAQLEEKYKGLVQEEETLNAQLTSERHSAAELRQSLQMAMDNLSNTHTQLRTAKEDFFHNKDELEKLQVEYAKARDDSEEERGNLNMHQAASLARIDELTEEMARAKLHPFSTFFVNLFEITIAWLKSVFGCFGRLRTRRALDPLALEENMPSP